AVRRAAGRERRRRPDTPGPRRSNAPEAPARRAASAPRPTAHSVAERPSAASIADRAAGVPSGVATSMTRMPSPGPRRWLRWVLVAVGVGLLLAAGAVAAIILHSPGNVSHPDVEFTAPTTTTTTTATALKPKKRAVDNFQWPR